MSAAALAAEVRVPLSAANTDRLTRCCGAASTEAEHAVGTDHWAELAGELGQGVILARGVEWWKANDAAFGVIGSSDVGALRAPRDGFGRHADALGPIGRDFGIA